MNMLAPAKGIERLALRWVREIWKYVSIHILVNGPLMVRVMSALTLHCVEVAGFCLSCICWKGDVNVITQTNWLHSGCRNIKVAALIYLEKSWWQENDIIHTHKPLTTWSKLVEAKRGWAVDCFWMLVHFIPWYWVLFQVLSFIAMCYR